MDDCGVGGSRAAHPKNVGRRWTMQITVSRIASLCVAIFAFFLTGVFDGRGAIFALMLLLPLALVWFPEDIGEAKGWIGHGFVDRPTPTWIVAGVGWIGLIGLLVAAYCLRGRPQGDA